MDGKAMCHLLQAMRQMEISLGPGLEGFGQYPVFTVVFTGKYRPGKNRFWTPKVGKTGKNTT